MSNGFTFTQLIEPTSYVGGALPANFDPNMAYFLGQCCSLTALDFGDPATYDPTNPSVLQANLTALSGSSSANQLTFSNAVVLNRSETIASGGSATTPGYFTTVPAGFAVTVTQSKPRGSTPATFNVIALRGTTSYAEWIDDFEMYPAQFALPSNNSSDPTPSVEAGFLAAYCTGTNGVVSKAPLQPGAQATGSMAAQVQAAIDTFYPKGGATVPLYVTGHSLGGALAALCALDVASNYPTQVPSVSMYGLASPRAALGIDGTGFVGGVVASLFSAEQFLNQYQAAVSNTFLIVNAADLVPILPSSSITLPMSMTLVAYHVTDSYVYQVRGKSVSGGLPGNVVTFCAQTGSISGNHSCADVYVPYLAQLAASAGSS